MASTYTDLGVELMVTGENAGTWGTKTNTNLNLIEQISGGYAIQTLNAAGTGANTTDLAKADGALGATVASRVIILGAVSPQAITGNKIVTMPVLTENFYIIKNSTSGAYTVQLKAASGSGATVTWATGDKGWKIVYFDGVATNTGVYDVGIATLTGVETLTNKTLTSPVFSGTATNFTSTGIDDNATSTAITIDSSENVSLTSILKVDTVQDQDGNNIINENANTITIGASGDTITIPSGATLANSGIITGFESTGIDDNADATAITINSSEQVEFTAGTALLPAITTTGDANTGMWFPAADTIAFSEGGSEVMRIDSSGKVGVGTSSPSQALDVVGSIEVSDGIYIGGTAAANKLDDYEEGTWTPSITTAGGTLSVTYAERAGKYTKIGNIVTYEFYIETSVFSGGTGNLTFGGLPFTVQAGRGALGIAAGSRIDLGIESAVIIPSQSSSNFLVRIKNSTGTGTSDNLTTLDASDWSNNNPTLMYGAGYYRTDS